MKVLNFGSLNCDYVYRLSHIVSPGETISSNSLETHCGGKGLNQSIALRKAGLEVYHAGSIGREGNILIEQLQAFGVNTQYVQKLDMPNGHAIIQLSESGENSIVLFGGANEANSKEFIDNVLYDFKKGDYIILQNEINNIAYIVNKAKERGLYIILNPSPFNDKILDCGLNDVSMIFINEVEGEQITGEKDNEKIIDSILEKYPDMKIILTLGKNGAIYADKAERHFQRAIKTAVIDTTAAGDTFMGYFIASTIKNETKKTALLMAATAASIAVSKVGAANSIPELEDVLSASSGLQ